MVELPIRSYGYTSIWCASLQNVITTSPIPISNILRLTFGTFFYACCMTWVQLHNMSVRGCICSVITKHTHI